MEAVTNQGRKPSACDHRDRPDFEDDNQPRTHLDQSPAATFGMHNPRYAITMFAERGPRLANLGYFGHIWELYAA